MIEYNIKVIFDSENVVYECKKVKQIITCIWVFMRGVNIDNIKTNQKKIKIKSKCVWKESLLHMQKDGFEKEWVK